MSNYEVTIKVQVWAETERQAISAAQEQLSSCDLWNNVVGEWPRPPKVTVQLLDCDVSETYKMPGSGRASC